MTIQLSPDAARRLLLSAQGLDRRPGRAATKADLLATIRRLGALQIDTINVVARSPYLVLWSRVGAYEPPWLDELLAEGALFEYWSHAACFLPIEDYALYRHRMLEPQSFSWQDGHEWLASRQEEVVALRTLIRERGPVSAADFAGLKPAGGWWAWKPEKRLLEALFNVGELMIARRVNFQRVYDLRERVLPGWEDSRLATRESARRALVLKAVRALGVATVRWVAGYFFPLRAEAAGLLAALVHEGALLPVAVEGWKDPAYLHPENLPLVEAPPEPGLTTLLSPFDPLLADRARTRAVFGFDYAIECYTPAARRRYGYFSLPILHRGALVGRLDPKAHRREGFFEVKVLHLEPGVPPTEELLAGLACTLRACAAWHRTPKVVVRASDPPEVAGRLQERLA